MVVRPEIMERMTGQHALFGLARAAEVEDGIDAALRVRLDRGGNRIRPTGVEEMGQRQEPIAADATVRIDAHDSGKVGPLVPQLGRPADLVDEERQDFGLGQRTPGSSHAEVFLGDVLRQEPGL